MASNSILYFLAVLLDACHIFLMIFILTGWLFQRVRLAHFLVVVLTGLSWLTIGQGNGFGNCMLTEWHWQILRNLGETDHPETYAQYLFERITGITVRKDTSMAITRSAWLLSLILSSVLLFRQYFYWKLCSTPVQK